MKFYVLPYQKVSASAITISNNINAKRIKLVNSKWKPKSTRIVINWGHAQAPNIDIGKHVLNWYWAVTNASNKWTALVKMEQAGVSVPKNTGAKAEAESWFDKDKKCVVFCRTLLRSSGGKGIVIAKSKAELVDAPLYTLRIRKTDEYRVHVFKNEVIDVAQKRLRNGVKDQEGRNEYIRNLANGWIFAHENVNCPDNVKQEALKAVAALELDFGAVDVVVDKEGKAYVLEVNTAPGLENQQTIQAYTNAFNNYKKKEEEKQYANKQQHKMLNRLIY